MAKKQARYAAIITWIFNRYYRKGLRSFKFTRDDIEKAVEALKISRPKNLGDVIYSFRFRAKLPEAITSTASSRCEWIIRLAGTAKYRFCLSRYNRIVPSEGRYQIKIPDSTPEIISRYALDDEQALLAMVRYNRLIDVFLGITAYSLQNHLRTTVPDVGQVETDEIYVGIRKSGEQFIIPVQAKGGSDKIGLVQVEQDLLLCQAKYPSLTPRLVAVQFQRGDEKVIVMFELTIQKDNLRIIDERHYRLVPYSEIDDDDLATMRE